MILSLFIVNIIQPLDASKDMGGWLAPQQMQLCDRGVEDHRAEHQLPGKSRPESIKNKDLGTLTMWYNHDGTTFNRTPQPFLWLPTTSEPQGHPGTFFIREARSGSYLSKHPR